MGKMFRLEKKGHLLGVQSVVGYHTSIKELESLIMSDMARHNDGMSDSFHYAIMRADDLEDDTFLCWNEKGDIIMVHQSIVERTPPHYIVRACAVEADGIPM